MNLCVLPSQLAGGGGSTNGSNSDAGTTSGQGTEGTPTGDSSVRDAGPQATGASGAGADADSLPSAPVTDPVTGALASRSLACGENTCGGQEQCCASSSLANCRPKAAWCGCSTCVTLMCDDFSDCPEGTVCCANAEPGTRCMPPSACLDALGCGQTEGCLGPLVCTLDDVVQGRCRGLVESVY